MKVVDKLAENVPFLCTVRTRDCPINDLGLWHENRLAIVKAADSMDVIPDAAADGVGLNVVDCNEHLLYSAISVTKSCGYEEGLVSW